MSKTLTSKTVKNGKIFFKIGILKKIEWLSSTLFVSNSYCYMLFIRKSFQQPTLDYAYVFIASYTL